MRPALLVLGLLVLPVLAPLAAAVNPLDDDAGSGRDAGDIPEFAVPIEPGTHHGRLMRPLDIWDHYRLEAKAGQVVRLSLETDAYAVAYVEGLGEAYDGESVDVVVPTDGSLVITVATVFVVLAPQVDVANYRFSVEFITAPGSAWSAGEGSAKVVEIVSLEPARATLTLQVAFDYVPQEPLAGLALFEWSTEEDPYLWWASAFSSINPTTTTGWSGLGDTVSLTPGMQGGVSVPRLETNMKGAAFTQILSVENLRWARVVVHTSIPSGLVFTALADRPFTHAFGDDVTAFTWDDRDSGAEVQLLAPGISVTGPRDLDRPLSSRTVAFFHTGGWDGIITDPQGQTKHLDFFRPSAFVIFPEPGTWTFGLGATVGAGFGALRLYLHEVTVPSLGLAPVPT